MFINSFGAFPSGFPAGGMNKRIESAQQPVAPQPQGLPPVQFGNESQSAKSPTLVEQLDASLEALAQTEPAKALLLKAQRQEFFRNFGENASVLLILTQVRQSLKRFPIPAFMLNVPLNYAIADFAKLGFSEAGLKASLAKYDQLNGDMRYGQLLEYCDGLAKQNMREFLKVPTA
jgi:hypothetical protein